MTKKRSAAIDMVKGLSILTLFFLHFEDGFFIFDHNYFIVRSPAFYIVVGWLWGMSSNTKTVQSHWQKRKQGLVKPYIWMSLIFLTFDLIVVLLKLQDSFVLWRDLYKTLCLRGIGTLWFLPALLGGEMLFITTQKYKIKRRIVFYIISLSLIYCFMLWSDCHYIGNENLKHIVNAPMRVVKDVCDAYLYITMAFFLARYFGEKIIGQSKSMLFVQGTALLVIAYYILNFSVGDPLMGLMLFMMANFISGIGILMFFTSIESIKIVAYPFVYFGKNSLIVMAFHFCLLFQIALIFDKVVMHHTEYLGAITLVYFGVAVIAQIALVELINRKLPFIIGK